MPGSGWKRSRHTWRKKSSATIEAKETVSSSELSQPDLSHSARLRSKAAKWRESPERLAWIIMLISFAIFCFLAITVPVAFNYTLRYAAVEQDAKLSAVTRTTGKVLLYPNTRSEPILVREEPSTVAEGMRIVSLDGAAQGTLEFFSETSQKILGSLQIYSDTDLEVERNRRPFFGSSEEPYAVRLKMTAGQVRILSSGDDTRLLRIDLVTPQGLVRMQEGSYQIAVDPNKTEVQVRAGQAELSADNATAQQITQGETTQITTEEVISTTTPPGQKSLQVHQSETAQIAAGQIITLPTTLGQNWIVNGTFKAPVSDVWAAGPAENVVFPGEVSYVDGGEQQVAQFSEWNANGHSDIGITQMIDRKLDGVDSLVLQMDVKILFQSLPGAGQQASEYPVRAEIDFTDSNNKEIKWGYGFYQRELTPADPFPPPTDNESGRVIRVQQGEWYTFESEDLIQLWKNRGITLARVNSIRIYASGHNYQSMVREVYLLAR
jgi:hypothetical protein